MNDYKKCWVCVHAAKGVNAYPCAVCDANSMFKAKHEGMYIYPECKGCAHLGRGTDEFPCNECNHGTMFIDGRFLNGTQPVIKDSGDRREFSTGAVRDMAAGKGRMDLIPWAAVMEVAKHCEAGALKYGEHNVDKGIPVHSFIDSAFRHLAKHADGWDDEPHLIAAAWNILYAIQMGIKHPELNDIPWREDMAHD